MKTRKKILLSDDANDFRAGCQERLRERGYDVILRKRDGFDVLSAIQTEFPDLVVMDAQMRHIDAVGVLNSVKSASRIPKFIITSSFSNAFTEKVITETPGCVGVLRPVEISVLVDRIEALLQEDEPPASMREEQEQQLEIIVTDILHQIGVPAHIKGYHYLRRAIIFTLQDMKIINSVTKQLYPGRSPIILRRAPSRVERAIRHAIEVAWDRGDVEVLNSYFGYTIQNSRRQADQQRVYRDDRRPDPAQTSPRPEPQRHRQCPEPLLSVHETHKKPPFSSACSTRKTGGFPNCSKQKALSVLSEQGFSLLNHFKYVLGAAHAS